jgi:hypothetical protein
LIVISLVLLTSISAEVLELKDLDNQLNKLKSNGILSEVKKGVYQLL